MLMPQHAQHEAVSISGPTSPIGSDDSDDSDADPRIRAVVAVPTRSCLRVVEGKVCFEGNPKLVD